jgi:F-type H+-transporting ATPase subunit b
MSMQLIILLALAESSIQLVPDGTILVHMLLVLVMVAVVNSVLLRPVNKILDERERRTSGRLSEAERTMASAKEKLRAWERGLRDARNEGYKLLENERANALREREVQVGNVKKELAELVTVQKSEIQRQQNEAERTLEVDARRLASLIGSQILGRSIST